MYGSKPVMPLLTIVIVSLYRLEFIMGEFWNKVKSFFKKVGSAIKGAFNKSIGAIKSVWNNFTTWFKDKTKNVKWPEVWDKCTTGLLIFLMCSPFLILGYIVLWFVLR